MRILIAEDEVGIAKALKLVLEKNRFAVDMVHNGLDALEYMLSVSYDTVVLDIMMPGLDGLEVLKRARERGITAPVLFLTAKAEGEDERAIVYTDYMGGDIAETVIRTDRPELPNALIFGDSFTNPVECLAYYSFNELRSVDLRHYTAQSLSDYIAAYQPDVLCVRDYQSLLLREFNGDFFS